MSGTVATRSSVTSKACLPASPRHALTLLAVLPEAEVYKQDSASPRRAWRNGRDRQAADAQPDARRRDRC
ncbi:unnamed protein product [Closterium sp. Naga37s-1]|nr:unnamed protein product [Closterium sp. Naga37s-1]